MNRTFVLLVLTAFSLKLSAQSDPARLRVSLLTCGTGPEIWETFGHAAIRVTDSTAGTDNVYNYGTFNGYEEGFELKFMKGKLLYYVSYYPYAAFIREYSEANRSVTEQELLLDEEKKQEIYAFLRWNSLEENKYYKYDFVYDNCATRIRDVFPRTLGSNFKFGQTMAPGTVLSFRQIINQYLYRNHFERFGINLLFGRRSDKVMTGEDIMFLPDFLRPGIAGATVGGRRLAASPLAILPGSPVLPAGVNGPLLLTLSLALLLLAGTAFRPLYPLGNFMSNALLAITGLAGVIMVFMWLGTDHQVCGQNMNLLWALPTNLLLAFARKKNKGRYALSAIFLLLISLALHILKVQELPLLELSPLLISMLLIYGMIYRKNNLGLY